MADVTNKILSSKGKGALSSAPCEVRAGRKHLTLFWFERSPPLARDTANNLIHPRARKDTAHEKGKWPAPVTGYGR